mgnify:CR=1 FL=1
MKLPVYDSVNKNRLLGHIDFQGNITAPHYRCQLMETPLGSFFGRGEYRGETRTVLFDIQTRSVSNSVQTNKYTRTITTVETKVLETAADLSDLIKLDRFTVGGEEAIQPFIRTTPRPFGSPASAECERHLRLERDRERASRLWKNFY